MSADIPVVPLPDGAGTARVIAGALAGRTGPARTFTPINVWDVALARDADVALGLPEGHTAILVVLNGRVTVNGTQDAGEAAMILLGRDGAGASVHAEGDRRADRRADRRLRSVRDEHRGGDPSSRPGRQQRAVRKDCRVRCGGVPPADAPEALLPVRRR